ncbi:unnamed protein product [Caenorhabditis auriculariae]|uniref:Uncharacterized protein n=1 Tax=Caenorhabditis auriculariae TaxID=2777116 RepID=A0A8S1HQG8_9PELO|nr:unnamed protein product [Caenorhabditis auriculariae]
MVGCSRFPIDICPLQPTPWFISIYVAADVIEMVSEIRPGTGGRSAIPTVHYFATIGQRRPPSYVACGKTSGGATHEGEAVLLEEKLTLYQEKRRRRRQEEAELDMCCATGQLLADEMNAPAGLTTRRAKTTVASSNCQPSTPSEGLSDMLWG